MRLGEDVDDSDGVAWLRELLVGGARSNVGVKSCSSSSVSRSEFVMVVVGRYSGRSWYVASPSPLPWTASAMYSKTATTASSCPRPNPFMRSVMSSRLSGPLLRTRMKKVSISWAVGA